MKLKGAAVLTESLKNRVKENFRHLYWTQNFTPLILTVLQAPERSKSLQYSVSLSGLNLIFEGCPFVWDNWTSAWMMKSEKLFVQAENHYFWVKIKKHAFIWFKTRHTLPSAGHFSTFIFIMYFNIIIIIIHFSKDVWLSKIPYCDLLCLIFCKKNTVFVLYYPSMGKTGACEEYI